MYGSKYRLIYCNCSIHLCKSIRCRNMFRKTETTHADNKHVKTSLSLEEIYKKNNWLFTNDLLAKDG